jgi:integrase
MPLGTSIMPKISGISPRDKPAKPNPDFPLFAHATGRWAKKIRGKFHYFGHWENPDGALQLYQEQRDHLHAGRTPRNPNGSLTVRDLANRFLTAKQHLADTGEITTRTFNDYYAFCERLGVCLGWDRLVDDLASDDFERLRAKVAKKWGPVALGNEIQRVRSVFKFAFDSGLIDKPTRYGPMFKRPSKTTLRQVRHAKGERMFEPKQIRAMIDGAGVQLRAMLFLAINCGFGNSDVAKLPIAAFDMRRGWVKFPRPKTAIQRRCPLWPETIKAVREAIAARPAPRDRGDSGLVFITSQGRRWAKDTPDSPIAKETAKLLRKVKINRKGLGFYALRHVFETIGGETRDQVAVDALMGHDPAANDMARVYRERISDERLKAVTDFVHDWLLGPGMKIRTTSGSRTAQIGNLVSRLLVSSGARVGAGHCCRARLAGIGPEGGAAGIQVRLDLHSP